MSEPNTPDRTAYQKYLQRVFNRIHDEAWKAVAEHESDPARFEQRKRLLTPGTKEHTRLQYLQRLNRLETKPVKTAFDTWLALLLAGQARIKAPLWAVRRMEEIGDGRLHKKWGLKPKTLDQAFGFPREARKRMTLVRQNELFKEVWSLTLLGFAVKPACLMVARRYQRDQFEQDGKRFYGQWRLGKGKRGGLEEVLRKAYKAWRVKSAGWIKQEERGSLAYLATHRDEHLQRYPPDSLPKVSLVEGARRRFDKKISVL